MQNVEGFQLSLQQEHLWRSALRGGDNLCAQSVTRLRGDLNAAMLRGCVREVSERHEILRTKYHCPPDLDLPFQVVAAEASLLWHDADLSALDEGGRQLALDNLLEQEWRAAGDLAREIALRMVLAKLAPDEHLLILTLPALCADHVTLGCLFEEIAAVYSRGEAADLVSAPFQYADYSAWQHDLLEANGDGSPEGEFARSTRLVLPFEGRAVSHSASPNIVSVTIGANELARATELGARYESSTAAVLLACWQMLLWRRSGEEEITILQLNDGRNYEELRAAMGYFAWYIPLRLVLQREMKFGELLRQVEQSCRRPADQLALADNSDYGDEGKRHPSDLPIGFAYAELPHPRRGAGMVFTPLWQRVRSESLKLALNCLRGDGHLTADFEYERSLFRDDDVRRLTGEFHAMLSAVLDAAEGTLDSFDLLNSTERRKLLIEFNNTRVPRADGALFHELFEQQVERAPESVAVKFEQMELTYRKLNERANQLAHHLRAMGVGPEGRVVILLERSLEVVVGMLAILKAGGAYVPLDPTQPKHRLALILQDLDPVLVLTDHWLGEMLPPDTARTVYMDEGAFASESGATNISGAARAENLAYVIYTSGSTGVPKGVGIEHRQLLSYLHGIIERLELGSGAGYAMVSTFAADLANTAIFPALATGGCLHVISSERISNPEALAAYFRHNAIDYLKIVPAHLEALLQSSQAEAILPRRLLVLGGEAASASLIKQLASLNPFCAVVNHYGPTETTVGVLTSEVGLTGSASGSDAAATLGRPLPDSSAYILDDRLRPLPVWATGELYIGGNSVARGYLNHPDQTASRFMPDLFGASTGARLYRTGDLARFLPDGRIEFLGRADHQVKIRGYRIELGEIERVLAQHDGLRETVVKVHEEASGAQTLAAYVVPRQLPAPSAVDLHHFLTERLPEYMVPTAFVTLDALPLTANGKIDRRKLPAPDRFDGREMIAPRNPIEEALVNIWAEVLGTEEVGVYDNFFELGGDSLVGMQLFSRVQNSFQLELPLRLLFESPTVAAMAEAMIAYEERPGQVESIANILLKVDEMSPDDMNAMLAQITVG